MLTHPRHLLLRRTLLYPWVTRARSRWGARDRADRARARRGKKRNEIPIYTHGTLVS